MLLSYNPWSELERMRREIDNVFGSYGRPEAGYSFPLTNIYDNKENVVVTAELAGMKKEDVNVSLTEGVLTISGKREPAKTGSDVTIIRQERATGDFEKSFRIPSKVMSDKIKAEFKDGILTVTLPKSEEAKPKQITIDVK